jgi:branched-chain amino acid transport system permease protein
MRDLVQTLVDGLGLGSIYAALALALVLIHRATGIVNFAQGEMGMVATFGAWSLLNAGLPLAAAVALALAGAFAGGMLIERVVMRPIEGRPQLSQVIVTLGLFIALGSLAGWIWGHDNHAFPSLFGDGATTLFGVRLRTDTLGTIGLLIAVVALLQLLLARTRIGLQLRAVAADQVASQLAGVPLGRTLMLGWGLAGALSALAGILIAPSLFLDVTFMRSVLIYAFAAAALGGFDSPLGAVVGGWTIGVAQSLASAYVDPLGGDLNILVPLIVILAVLLVKPSGLFGVREAVRA